MCGRFPDEATEKEAMKEMKAFVSRISERIGTTDALGKEIFQMKYNILPTTYVRVVVNGESGNRELDLFRWGLVPHWTKDVKKNPLMINAKSETIAEKPSFRESFKQRRCIVTGSGFYEWKKLGGKEKQPMLMRLKDEPIMPFAGIWSTWTSPEGMSLNSCAIITTGPNELMADIHDRMPVILHRDDIDLWMDTDFREPEELMSLLRPYEAEGMTAYPVNKLEGDGPECVEHMVNEYDEA